MALSLAWLCRDRSVPRGRYWRSKRLVFSFEPRCQGDVRIAEIDLDVGRQCQALVIGEFFASVPGQGLVEFAGQSLRLFDQCRDDAFGVFVGDLDQHHVARVALDQRGDIAVLRSADQVTLPVAGNGAILDEAGLSRMETASLIWPRPLRFRLACLERRIVRLALRCSSSSFFSTPRAWITGSDRLSRVTPDCAPLPDRCA